MGLFSKIKDALADVQQQNRENAKEKTAPKEIFDRLRNKLDQVQKEQQTRKSSKRGRTRGSIFSQIKEQFEEAQKENATSKKEETASEDILAKIHREMEAIEKNKKIKVEKKAETQPDWGSPSGLPQVDDILGRVLAGAEKEQRAKKVEPKKAEDFGSIFDSIMGGGSTKKSSSTSSQKTSSRKTSPPPKLEKKPSFGDILDQLIQEEKKKPKASSSVTRNTAGLQIGGTAMVDSGGSLAMRIEPKMSAGTLSDRLPRDVNVRLLDYSDRHKINLDGKVTGWYLVDYQGMQGWILESYLE